MASTVGKLSFLVGANTGSFQRSMSGVAARVRALGQSRLGGFFRSMAAGAAGAFASLMGVHGALGAVNAAIAALKRGMGMEEMSRSFGSLADSIGSTAGSMLGKLREATYGAVSDFDLMKAANNAMLLGVAQSDEGFASLANKAVRLGQAMGRGPVEALNDLTLGIGRQSRLILDNLGIVVNTEEAYAVYAASLGKTVEQLTEAERKQAFFNATLAAVDQRLATLPTRVESGALAFARLGASILNIIDYAMVPVLQAATPFVAMLAAAIQEIPVEPIAAAMLGAFGGMAQVIAFVIDNVKVVIAAFQTMETLALGIAAALAAAVHGMISAADSIAKAVPGGILGDFSQAKAASGYVAQKAAQQFAVSQQQTSQGLAEALNSSSAQDMVSAMLDRIRSEMRSGPGGGLSGGSDAARASQALEAVAPSVEATQSLQEDQNSVHVKNQSLMERANNLSEMQLDAIHKMSDIIKNKKEGAVLQ